MKKLKKFCKKPLLITSLVVIAVFALSLVIMAIVPYANATYTNRDSDGSRIEVTFKGDKAVTVGYNSDGEKSGEIETYFKVEDGELKTSSDKSTWFSTGYKINAYRMSYTVLGVETVYSCGLTNAMRIIDFVMIGLGAVGLVVSVVVLATDKKRK
ncbi:MAG: hypothetical protein IJS68_01985 [Clostridia bacterium]|nr:hypothetical protein [Clostridia bacterium]